MLLGRARFFWGKIRVDLSSIYPQGTGAREPHLAFSIIPLRRYHQLDVVVPESPLLDSRGVKPGQAWRSIEYCQERNSSTVSM